MYKVWSVISGDYCDYVNVGIGFRCFGVVDGEGIESICRCDVGMVGWRKCMKREVRVWKSLVGYYVVYEFCE